MSILEHADGGSDPKMPWWNRILGAKLKDTDAWYPILFSVADGDPTKIKQIEEVCTYEEIARAYCMKIHNNNLS